MLRLQKLTTDICRKQTRKINQNYKSKSGICTDKRNYYSNSQTFLLVDDVLRTFMVLTLMHSLVHVQITFRATSLSAQAAYVRLGVGRSNMCLAEIE